MDNPRSFPSRVRRLPDRFIWGYFPVLLSSLLNRSRRQASPIRHGLSRSKGVELVGHQSAGCSSYLIWEIGGMCWIRPESFVLPRRSDYCVSGEMVQTERRESNLRASGFVTYQFDNIGLSSQMI